MAFGLGVCRRNSPSPAFTISKRAGDEEEQRIQPRTGSHCAKAAGIRFSEGACGWSGPLRLIKNGLDIKGPLSFNLSAAAVARSNAVL